jgi:hypothetical protein
MDDTGYTLDNTLGESAELLELSSAKDNYHVALELVRQARREVYVVTHDLDPPVYNQEAFIDALSAFARQSRYSHARFLIRNSDKALKQGHRLLPLAQRLSSRIKLHNPGFEHRDFIEAFIVVDGIGYIWRQLANRFDGEASFKAPLKGRDLRALFLEMWERSEPDPQLRRLQI